MEEIPVQLTAEQFEELNSRYPETSGSWVIGKRAVAIVRIHIESQHPGAEVRVPRNGADLEVRLGNGDPPQLIEVKGTAVAQLAFQQLKVSSQHSWELLTGKGIPVYRVCSVFAEAPTIYVLRHGYDFSLDVEPRWAFKPANGRGALNRKNRTMNASSRSASRHSNRQGKYDALRDYLSAQKSPVVTLTFEQIRTELGIALPQSAYAYQAWWSNQAYTANRPQARAWMETPYRVDGVLSACPRHPL